MNEKIGYEELQSEEIGRISRLLRSQSILVLASADRDGLPRSAPLFFLADEMLRLYWFSTWTSRHSRNCARDPRAAVAISRPARNWRQIAGVQMEGRVAVVRSGALRRRMTAEYCARFGLDESFAETIRKSSLYCFTPEWVRYVDNSRRFGEKIELRSKREVNPSRTNSPRRRSSGRESDRGAGSRAG